MMMTVKDWLAKHRPDVEIPTEGSIPMEWFSEQGLPAIVACSICETTMILFSAFIDEETSRIFCHNCAGED